MVYNFYIIAAVYLAPAFSNPLKAFPPVPGSYEIKHTNI